jgi:beta-lactamase class A
LTLGGCTRSCYNGSNVAATCCKRKTFGIPVLAIVLMALLPRVSGAAPAPFKEMRAQIRRIATHFPGDAAFEVLDLTSGLVAGFNANASMPAASTIKVAVMVEVFKKLEEGTFTLDHHVILHASDRDDGSGDLAFAPIGSSYTVSDLLSRMIDVSDNTAANMLIRLVGRRNINRTMYALGLRHTWLSNSIHTDDWAVRDQLRSSPADMVRLLRLMAQRKLVDEWSSNQMIDILEADQINSLLPAALPADIPIAHKTGSFSDTLDDVGIVYAVGTPYVIAVMTTGLASQDTGTDFIHRLSRDVYTGEQRLAAWRMAHGFGIGSFAVGNVALPVAPDVRYWDRTMTKGSGGI